MILVAYAGAQMGRLDPVKSPSLAMNLVGACLILLSLIHAFNLAAFLMEGAWALVAALALMRLALRAARSSRATEKEAPSVEP